jgi:hypothetical protein
VEADDLLIALLAAPPSLPLPALSAGHRRRFPSGGHRLGHDRPCGRLHLGPPAPDRLQQGPTAVLEQVPPIGGLNGRGCPLARTLGVGAGTVTADHLHPGMPPQPVRERLGASVRQEVDNPAPLKVAQDRAVAVAAAPRPIIHAEHPRGLAWCLRRAATEHAEQGGSPNRHGQAERKPRPGLAAERKADVALEVGQPRRPARPWLADLGQALAEDLARAGVRDATEPSGLDMEGDHAPLPGQVGQGAPVTAVHPSRDQAA